MLKVGPIITNNLFPIERKALLEILSTIRNEQWFFDTACEGWCIKDIVQHLLKDDIGILSRKRDGFRISGSSSKEFKLKKDFIDYVNIRNQEWVEVSKSFSPRVLIEFLELTGKLTYDYWQTVDLAQVEAKVSWVSDELLPNWVDIAREYTERWLHQAHIREALALRLLDDKELFHPFIQAYMLALPLTYKSVTADNNDTIKIIVDGKAGGRWSLVKNQDEWDLYNTEYNGRIVTEITIDQDTLWRLFSKGMLKEKARESVKILGNKFIGEYVFNTISLIA